MHVFHSNACKHGIGSYSLTSGRAWHWEIPVDCQLKVSLNCLEFIACYVTIWIDIIKGQVDAESCLLSQTDSTSAEGRKSNFDKDSQSANSEVTRTIATTMISAKCCLYSHGSKERRMMYQMLYHLIITSLTLYLPLYSPPLSHTSSQMGLQSNPCWRRSVCGWFVCCRNKQESTCSHWNNHRGAT